MNSQEPILFLEPAPRIRLLFESFWGSSRVENPLIDFSSEDQFWKGSPDLCGLLIVDEKIIKVDLVEWIQKLDQERPEYKGRVIYVVETKEERDKWIAKGVDPVLRLPFQWSQWLSTLKKMGFQWALSQADARF